MPVIAHFVLATDAAFFQTLLKEKGIPSTLLGNDSRVIDVPDEHVAHAQAIYTDYAKDNPTRADMLERTHPNRDYPFFAVWMLTALAFMLLYAALFIPSMRSDADFDAWLFFAGTMLLTGIIGGLVVSSAIALLRMIPTAFKRGTGETGAGKPGK